MAGHAMKNVRLIKVIPKSRLRLISGDGNPPSVGDLGETDHAYSTPDGQMTLIYFASRDNSAEWEAEAYDWELGIGIEPGTTNEELIRRFGLPQKRDPDGKFWIYNRKTETISIYFNDDGTVHETRFDQQNPSSH